MKITFFGVGYVGLVSASCFADLGNDVICVDTDISKIESLQFSKIPFFEPGLEELVKLNLDSGRLKFTSDPIGALHQSEVIFIAVGTPTNADGSANLKYVFDVANTIGENVFDKKLIIVKSTVPVGTSKKIYEIITNKITERNIKSIVTVVSNPEFLREGSAIRDFLYPDRVVIGTDEVNQNSIINELYSFQVQNGTPIVIMDRNSSEMTKYASNAMLATKISFINEIANLCDIFGADIEKVRFGIGLDKRIGHEFLKPGLGYGGSCFPKDVSALINLGSSNNYKTLILEAVQETNKKQRFVMLDKISGYYKKLEGQKLTIWGLSFKPETDDMREAPSIDIVNYLLNQKTVITVYDPIAQENAFKYFGSQIIYSKSLYESVVNADGLLIITEWHAFKNCDLKKIKENMSKKVIFDGRNVFNKEIMNDLGFDYFSIGR